MMRRRQQAPAGMFGSEEELCSAFIEVARAAGYQVHPECGTWDLLIVSRETGEQFGVHAKLKPNVSVLAQSSTPQERLPGPQVHAVLVPVANPEFIFVAKRLQLQVLEGVQLDRVNLREVFAKAPRWHHPSPEWAPDVEVRSPAGVSSPRRTTRWKMSAVELCLRARKRGYVTRAEMTELGLKMGWFLNPKLGAVLERRVVDGKRRRGEYVLRDPSSPLLPDHRYPEVVEALQKRDLLQAPVARPTVSVPPPRPQQSEPPQGPRLRVKKRNPSEPAQQRSTIRPPSTDEASVGPLPRSKAVHLVDDEDEEAASRK